MPCTNCEKNKTQCGSGCGCTAESLHINQICNPIVCDVDECAESFRASCILYTGEDLICDNVTIVSTDTNMAQAIANVIAYICTTNVTQNDILCGEDVVVPENTPLPLALGLITTYFCNQLTTLNSLACAESPILVPVNTPLNEALEIVFLYFCQQNEILASDIADILNDFPITVVAEGVGISVSSNVVGNVTTYTVTNSLPNVDPTLSSSGGTETLVNDGVGPTLAVKGLSAGDGISLLSTPTEVIISNNGVKKYISGPLVGNQPVVHNLASSTLIISVVQAVVPPAMPFIHGVDYNYSIDTFNQIIITEVIPGGLGTYLVTVIS